MLNAERITNRVYLAILDSPDGQGTYTRESMSFIVENAVIKFLETSQASLQKTIVQKRAWLHGLSAIISIEKNDRKIDARWEKEGNEIVLLHPKEATITWAYAGFEVNPNKGICFGDIKHTDSLNSRAEQAIVYLCQAEIYKIEARYNEASYFEEEGLKIARSYKRKMSNTRHKGGVKYGF